MTECPVLAWLKRRSMQGATTMDIAEGAGVSYAAAYIALSRHADEGRVYYNAGYTPSRWQVRG